MDSIIRKSATAMGLIIRLILGVVLIFTPTPFSVLAQTPNLYNRPSLQDKTGEYAIVVRQQSYPPPPKRNSLIYAHSLIPFTTFPTYILFPFSFLSFTVLQLAPKGCAAFIYNNGPDSYRYVCWDADVEIFPDYDGYYRITLYTGFTTDSKPAYDHPKYKHEYTWKQHRKVYINSAGCLRPCEFFLWGAPLSPSPPH